VVCSLEAGGRRTRGRALVSGERRSGDPCCSEEEELRDEKRTGAWDRKTLELVGSREHTYTHRRPPLIIALFIGLLVLSQRALRS
jgi:hypothetical protein